MPPVAPIPPGEPTRLGPYHLLGSLVPGVHLAASPDGGRVVVTRLPRPPAPGWADLVAALRRTAVIGTVLLLDGYPGLLVSEYVDGPGLDEVVRTSGPVAGTALHRLAIATMTAVAALHRAGVEHVRLQPGRVLLGPDGPRLLCHGTEPDPAWLTPEELRGDPAGAPADLFSWAATMVFAAGGRTPFAEGADRLAHGAANLDPLDGELRDLVADCLVSDPGDRPSAEEALLRLIGHAGALDTVIPDPATSTPA
ncbi:hypothetical protein IMZ11_42015, partial [Microtetraspora sp. AC03309]|nr:hypothetical protein [Microtetraspora sp. AC03309]